MSVIDDIRNGAKTALDNTTGLTQTYTSRPASVGSLPAGWVDEERIDWMHDAGTRQWAGEVDVVLVAQSWDNEEGQTSLDALTTSLLDYVSDHPHLMGANTVVEPVRARVTTEEFGSGVGHPASVVTLGRFVFMEGR